MDVSRVEEIVRGFQSFQESMAVRPSNELRRAPETIDPSTKEALKLIFAPEGSYLQELLLTEVIQHYGSKKLFVLTSSLVLPLTLVSWLLVNSC